MNKAEITVTFAVEADDPGFIVDAVEDLKDCITDHVAGYGLRVTSKIVTSVKNAFGEMD